MEPFNYDALKGIQCETELSCKFFSKQNIMHLHSEIIKAVQDKLKVNIDKQSDQELVIIMRAIFLQNAYESSDVARELKNLNLKVLMEIVPEVISKIKQHMEHLNNQNNNLQVMEHPVNVNSAGEKSMCGGGGCL
tara:strand:+ start:62 stop:466 length:405 start_codon:yes stop_codon:yes gene_type:complete